MTYRIKFSKQATSFFKRLSPELGQRVQRKWREIAKDPSHFLEHHQGQYHKIRIGDFRALVDVDSKRRIILVRVFDKRARIYKR